MQGEFWKNFYGRRRGGAARPRMQAREQAAMPRDALSARGARPAGGGVAAALPSSALGTSRVPSSAVFRFRGAGRHPLNGHPAGAGTVIGADRAPAHPAIPKLCRFTGPGRQPPGMT